MTRTIVRKEVLENILSYRFPLFSLICLLLIPLGMSVNQASYAKRVRDYSEQVRLADEAAAALKIQDIMAGTVAIKGFRRPAPLSVFTQGFESALPRYYEFTQDGFKPGESAGDDESILSVQGQVDFVFLVQMVISLIALLFASDTISGEKEAGTLRAMLANRLPRDMLLAGKIGGGYLALWIPFTLAFLIGAVVLMLSAFPLFGASTAVGAGDTTRRVIIVQDGSPAAKAGVKVGDVMQSLDGVTLADKETFSRLMAAKRWGDSATLVVKRGADTVTLRFVFRRTMPEK